MRRTLLILMAVASLGIVACAGKPKHADTPTAGSAVGAQSSGADSGSAAAGAEEGAAAQGPMSGTLAKRIVYFDFDSSEIKGDGTQIVAAHARYLAANPSIRVRLEGHTDERGSREYNIGLGERRAQAVRRSMLLQGVAETQLSTVSYGAERPAVEGHDESAWSKNRRVVINYVQ